MRTWECKVCGYALADENQPEKCPACGAEAEMIEEKAAAKARAEEPSGTAGAAAGKEKKWRCTICNYIHTGAEPPDECPVCGADKSYFVEIVEEPVEEEAQPAPAERKPAARAEAAEHRREKEAPEQVTQVQGKKPFGLLGALVLRFHLHPITVHIPNGVLPIVLVFLLLAIFFDHSGLELASFYNLVVVLVSLPAVVGTGYIAWQRKYRGARTFVFKAKLACSAVIALAVGILVVWRLLDPGIALAGGTSGLIYLIINAVALAAAGFAGTLGGRLVFTK